MNANLIVIDGTSHGFEEIESLHKATLDLGEKTLMSAWITGQALSDKQATYAPRSGFVSHIEKFTSMSVPQAYNYIKFYKGFPMLDDPDMQSNFKVGFKRALSLLSAPDEVQAKVRVGLHQGESFDDARVKELLEEGKALKEAAKENERLIFETQRKNDLLATNLEIEKTINGKLKGSIAEQVQEKLAQKQAEIDHLQAMEVSLISRIENLKPQHTALESELLTRIEELEAYKKFVTCKLELSALAAVILNDDWQERTQLRSQWREQLQSIIDMADYYLKVVG
jgi:hypothetical protein